MNLKFGVLIFGILYITAVDGGSSNLNKDLVNSPYLELILCPIRSEFWECANRQSRRLLDTWNSNLYTQWQKLKVEGDKELSRKLQSRGFSDIEDVKEKPSTILSKIEIGANYVQDFVKSALKRLYGNKESEADSGKIENEHEGRSLKDNNATEDTTRQFNKKPLHGFNQVDLSQHMFDLFGHGIKHGIKFPHKYGRSIGVQRGKKKKKKQLLMKLMLIATLIKGKIELLLKIFSAHLQVKFFLIALAGLIINVARFWLDFRRGITPQKVIYYEHSHHQHHYDDHGSDWGGGEEGGGGYWKRSLQTEQTNPIDSYNNAEPYGYHSTLNDDTYSPHRMAYSRQIPRIL